MNVTRIGLDLAKQVFQVHGVSASGKTVLRNTLRRQPVQPFFANLPPCRVGMASCGGAHYWARELRALGHDVRLMAPQFVQPYRKNGKNDGNDAEAICEAVGRPTMRFVPIKEPEQQAVLTLHRARQLALGERTALVNPLRGLLAEYGLVLAQGVAHVRRSVPALLEEAEHGLPALAREIFAERHARLRDLDRRLAEYDQRIARLAREMPEAGRLMQVEGVGPVIATALIASVGDARRFANGRQMAAWLGLVPRQYSSGGKNRLGRITKRGDVYLRTVLIHGARAVLRTLERRTDRKSLWVRAVKERRGYNNAIVALAAKPARFLWALLARGASYQPATAMSA